MEFLRLLEGIRTPAVTGLMLGLTYLGDETMFTIAAMILYWCVSKAAGRYIIATGMLGTVLNQWLKLVFRIPRPWVLDPEFTIVEGARATAGDYSFPSGHTQMAVGTYGGIARWTREKPLRILCLALAVLVPFSRMYLGVHTPLDVGVAAVVAVALLLVLYPPMVGKNASDAKVRAVLAGMFAVSAAFVIWLGLTRFPADADAGNLASGIGNAWKLLGSAAGIWLAFELDSRYIRFETKAVWWAQVLKIIGGLALMMGLRLGLKPLLTAVLGSTPVTDAIRYFILILTAGALWPMTFRWFARLGSSGSN